MRKHYFFSSLVIFVAGFVLSAIVDGRRLASITQASSAAPEAAAQIARQPSTLQKWEYRVVSKSVSHRNNVDLDFELNRLGEQGYEICEVVQSGSHVGEAILTITLRRPR